MSGKIKLIIAQGTDQEKDLVFQNPTRSVVGRAEDCEIRIPRDVVHMDISRHHCMFEIDPPTLKVRDLGSRNGTFVNGQKIGERSSDELPPDAGWEQLPAQELHEGDEVKIGHTLIRVAEVKPS